MNEEFFVHLPGANQARRELLSASKGVLTSLKRIEMIQLIRAEKNECMVQLKKTISDVAGLSRRLRSSLPKMNVKPELPHQPPQKAVIQNAQPPQSKLELLEEELAKVESTLTSLE